MLYTSSAWWGVITSGAGLITSGPTTRLVVDQLGVQLEQGRGHFGRVVVGSARALQRGRVLGIDPLKEKRVGATIGARRGHLVRARARVRVGVGQ